MWCKRHASTDATRAEPWKDRIQSHEQLMRAMFQARLSAGTVLFGSTRTLEGFTLCLVFGKSNVVSWIGHRRFLSLFGKVSWSPGCHVRASQRWFEWKAMVAFGARRSYTVWKDTASKSM